MELGVKSNYPETSIAAPEKPKNEVHYPSVTIEKKLGEYQVGDEFTAAVKFKVKSITQGKEYENDPDHHRCTLEMISLDSVKAKGKGLPQHGK